MFKGMYDQLLTSILQKSALNESEQESIRKFFIPKKIRKKQYLLNAGDACQYIAFVERGLLRSFSTSDDGHEHVLHFASEGWWISDMGSFISGRRCCL
jgi:CRP-like cAMP-binding protein